MQAEQTQTLAAIAGEAGDHFETRKRPDGDAYTTLKDGAPEWLGELVREAHGDFLPDDWRYTTVEHALDHIHDAGAETEADLDDLGAEFADQAVDVYTGARYEWLSSNLTRQGYCDDAAAEGLVPAEAGIVDRIGAGQYMEAQEVFASVAQSLVAHAEEG